MKPIVINDKNMERIQKELDEIQKRAKVRTITAKDISYACDRIEKKLGVTKKSLVGTVATIDPNAQDFPGAYKWIPESTSFTVKRTTSGWKLTDIYRNSCARSKDEYDITLTEATKEEILQRCSRLM